MTMTDGTDDVNKEALKSSIEDIREKVYDMHAVSVKNEEHLRNINGTIEKHEKRINGVEDDISTLNKRVWAASGALTIIFLALQIAPSVI